jgi:uncharacterized protein
MRQVEHGHLWVMRIHALLASLVLFVPAAIVALVLADEVGRPILAVPAAALLVAIYLVLVAPARHHRALTYALDSEELHIARGLWTRVETLVRLVRIQHIDVSQGPLERIFGVSRLVVHTAGTLNSLVTLPGLSRDTAETMRDEIRARIRAAEG